jgi:hypothetical protein
VTHTSFQENNIQCGEKSDLRVGSVHQEEEVQDRRRIDQELQLTAPQYKRDKQKDVFEFESQDLQKEKQKSGEHCPMKRNESDQDLCVREVWN